MPFEVGFRAVASGIGLSVPVEVKYQQRRADGLRHAVLKGILPDKRPRMIRRSAYVESGLF